MNQVKVWDRDAVVDLLQSSDVALARAILTLYERQTPNERADSKTVVSNGRGFNAKDAAFLSSIARALPKYGNRMTYNQARVARKMVPKYWRQLLEEIEDGGGVVSYGASSLKREAAKTPIIENEPVQQSLPQWGTW